MLEIHHSGQEPSKCTPRKYWSCQGRRLDHTCFFFFNQWPFVLYAKRNSWQVHFTTGKLCGSATSGMSVMKQVVLDQTDQLVRMSRVRHGIFPPIRGFPPIERSQGSFLRSVQIRWENYRVYLTCERFSESNFANLPHASISFLHGTFSNGVNLFCFGHHHSVHGLAESTTKGSNPIVTCKSAVYGM